MAVERQVNVLVDVKGKDNLSPIIDAQKKKAEELQRSMAQATQGAGAPGVPAAPASALMTPSGAPFQSDRVRGLREAAREDAAKNAVTANNKAFQAEQKLTKERERAGNAALRLVPGLGQLSEGLQGLRESVADMFKRAGEQGGKFGKFATSRGVQVGGAALGGLAGMAIGRGIGRSIGGEGGEAVGGILGGAAGGAAVGSVLPGVGTAIGAAVGAGIGAITAFASAMGGAAERAAKLDSAMSSMASSLVRSERLIRESRRATGPVSMDTVIGALPGAASLPITTARTPEESRAAILAAIAADDARRDRERLEATALGGTPESIRATHIADVRARLGETAGDAEAGRLADEDRRRTAARSVLERARRFGVTDEDESRRSGFGSATSVSDSIFEALAARSPLVIAAESTAEGIAGLIERVDALSETLFSMAPGV